MKNIGSIISWRAISTIVAAAALALPAQASSPKAWADGGSDSEFSDSFERFGELPETVQPRGNVVDLDTFDPPVEAEEETSGSSLGFGMASYYGKKFHGRRTASGEPFDMNAMTAAHKTLPFGTKLRVINPNNGKTVVVRINDRGPFTKGRTIDLSRSAAQEIGIVSSGHGRVELELLK